MKVIEPVHAPGGKAAQENRIDGTNGQGGWTREERHVGVICPKKIATIRLWGKKTPGWVIWWRGLGGGGGVVGCGGKGQGG
jgi:hypothetical protein